MMIFKPTHGRNIQSRETGGPSKSSRRFRQWCLTTGGVIGFLLALAAFAWACYPDDQGTTIYDDPRRQVSMGASPSAAPRVIPGEELKISGRVSNPNATFVPIFESIESLVGMPDGKGCSPYAPRLLAPDGSPVTVGSDPAGNIPSTAVAFSNSTPDGFYKICFLQTQGGTVFQSGACGTVTIGAAFKVVHPTLAFSTSSFTVDEDAGLATITVRRLGDTQVPVSVDYATSNGSASAGSDYTSTSGTLNFLAQETSRTFSVPILNDSVAESNETVNLTLSNPSDGSSLEHPYTAALTIVNGDPILRLGSAIYSANEASGSASITVIREGDTSGTAGANYSTSNGSAAAGSDYTSTSGVVNFASGETSKTITVPITNDTAAEADETFTFSLSSPTGGAVIVTPSNATISVVDNDPRISLNSGSLFVGESGGAGLSVLRQGGLSMAVSASLSTANGSALAGADYTAVTKTVSFAAGETSKAESIPILSDSTPEADENFNVSLANATGGASLSSPASATVTIVDDDPVIRFTNGSYTVDEATTAANISVSRQGGLSMTVSAVYGTSDGTATAVADYAPSSGAISFGPGQTSNTFAVPIVNDSTPEPNEKVNLSLSNPGGGATVGSPGAAVLTIRDKDPVVRFSSATYSSLEPGDSGESPRTITVVREGKTSAPVTVNYATSAGSASSGDYDQTSGTLSFASGETSKTFTVDLDGDGDSESDETVNLSLSGASGGFVVTPATAVLTILDDDPMFVFSQSNYNVSEGAGVAVITVNRQGALTVTDSIAWDTVGGMGASAGSDFYHANGTLTFGPNELSKTFTVQILEDSVDENIEEIGLDLDPINGSNYGPDSQISIIDND